MGCLVDITLTVDGGSKVLWSVDGMVETMEVVAVLVVMVEEEVVCSSGGGGVSDVVLLVLEN